MKLSRIQWEEAFQSGDNVLCRLVTVIRAGLQNIITPDSIIAVTQNVVV